MAEQEESTFEPDEQDIEVLVDTLRKCFAADKSRYYINNNTLIVEIEGLADLQEDEIAEIAEPVLDELDTGFDEVLLVNLKK